MGGLLYCGNPRSTAEGVKKEEKQWEGTLRWDVSLSVIEIQLNVISGWTSLITQLCPSHSLTLINLAKISYNPIVVFMDLFLLVPVLLEENINVLLTAESPEPRVCSA